jgi:hypothetical protein
MAKVGLKLNNVTKYLDDATEEVLGTVDGISLCRTGPFIYATGNGSGATPTRTVAIPRCVPPAAVGAANAEYGFCAGLVDSWQQACSALGCAASSATATATGAGTFRNWDIAHLGNSRPYMAGIIGDSGKKNFLSMKINGKQKDNIVPEPQANPDSVLRYRYACADPVLASGVTGTFRVREWGDVLIMNISGANFPAKTTRLGRFTTVASEMPKHRVPFQLINHNKEIYFKGHLTTDGYIDLESHSAVTQKGENAWGCAIWCYSDSGTDTPMWRNADLKIANVQKSLLVRGNSYYLSYHSTATPAADITAETCHVYRMGNFVFGHCDNWKPQGAAAAMNGKLIFTLPAGYRPKATSFSTGFAGQSYGAEGYTPAFRSRIATQIEANGQVKAWTHSSSYVATVGNLLSFYHYCDEAI